MAAVVYRKHLRSSVVHLCRKKSHWECALVGANTQEEWVKRTLSSHVQGSYKIKVIRVENAPRWFLWWQVHVNMAASKIPAVRIALFPFTSKDFTQDGRQMSNKATEFYKTQIMFTEFSFDCCLCFTLETKNQFLLDSSFQLRPLAVVQLVCRTSFHYRVSLCVISVEPVFC